MKFVIEQVALCPDYTEEAMELLRDMGLMDWVEDTVIAEGKVHGNTAANIANLKFNYDSAPRELEVLTYKDGVSWMDGQPSRVSHLGMHCTAEELEEWHAFFRARHIDVAQEVRTLSHTNPAIAGKRRYHYCIFDTHAILGVDIKFIVRIE